MPVLLLRTLASTDNREIRIHAETSQVGMETCVQYTAYVYIYVLHNALSP